MSTAPPSMEVHLISDGLPGPEHRDPRGFCWWGDPDGAYGGPCWNYGSVPDSDDTCWMSHDAMPLPAARPSDDEDDAYDDRDHPSLIAEERNPGLRSRMGV